MIIYIDNDYKCHVSNDGTLRAVESEFFDGKCAQYIEGYRYVPEGENWVSEDGTIFAGQMIAPWKPYAELAKAQSQYEHEQLEEMRQALNILGVSE